MFVNDSWSHWEPDPERAFREHDSTCEPFASMSRDELLARMREARGGREWEFLREFLLDKCTAEELEYDRFLTMLMEQGGLDRDELLFVEECAGMATRLVPSSSSSAGVQHEIEGG
jgi:hypothetical protein